MPEEVVPFAGRIDTTRFSVADTLKNLVDDGFYLRTNTEYQNRRYIRFATIFDERHPNLQAPSYGTGTGPTIEKAVIRAIYVNALSRGHQGKHPDSYPEAVSGPIRPRISGRSQLDHIYDDPSEEIWVFWGEEGAVAESRFGGNEDRDESLVVTGTTPVEALGNLALRYRFYTYTDDYLNKFPLTLFPAEPEDK